MDMNLLLVDTAPTMLVTDTLTIFEYADAIIYMIRTDFTELKILKHIKDLQKHNKTQQSCYCNKRSQY